MAADLRRVVPIDRGHGARRSEVAGLDALETQPVRGRPAWRRAWSGTVAEGDRDRHRPRGLGARRPERLEAGLCAARPRRTSCAGSARRRARRSSGPRSSVTLRRAVWGFGLAIVIGVGIGVLVSRFRMLRSAVGSLIMGLQTMPSIAWFPLAILLFKLTEEAITFVVVLGAAPSIANGLIHGVDHIPPVLTRAGRVHRRPRARRLPLRHPAGGDARLRRPASSRAGRSPGGA